MTFKQIKKHVDCNFFDELLRLTERSIYYHSLLTLHDYKAHTLLYEIATEYGKRVHAMRDEIRFIDRFYNRKGVIYYDC